MTPIFMVKRKDGKTDNVYECNFKTGTFIGGASSYSYNDIDVFYLSGEYLKALISKETRVVTKNTEKVDSDDRGKQ